ncbi:MAG: hypothetical protein ABIH70_02765 [Chloroflexota bacterium]
MSQFIDKLNRISQAQPRPLGFRLTEAAPAKARIQLVASIAQHNIDQLTEAMAGADAGLVHINKAGLSAKALATVAQAVPETPCGGWLPRESGPADVKQVLEAEFDFIVFQATSTPLSIFENETTSKILEVDASLNEGLLRAVNELSVDAVLLSRDENREDSYLTTQQLVIFHRFASVLDKPLLAQIPAEVTSGELVTLWKAGVEGIVVEVSTKQGKDKLNELRQIIDETTFPSRRRRKLEPLLPHIATPPPQEEEMEPEEEPDEEP